MKKRAFTLIELIIVVTIIAILSVVIIVSYVGAQAKSRDSKRKADLLAISAAMSIYYTDNKTFDMIGKAGNGTYGHFNFTLPGGRPSIATYLQTAGYIANPPKDPKYEDNTQVYDYYYTAQPTNYKIAGVYAVLESKPVKNWDSTWAPNMTDVGADKLNYGVKLVP